MQWLSLVTWVVVLMLVLPVGGTLLPSLGTLVMVVGVGLGTMIVFAVTGNTVWAWISFGMACVGVVLATVGARTLIEDSAQTLQGVGEVVKGVAALSLGVGLYVLVAVVPMTLGTAITT
jgi:hypothetical protein